jgi:uncharacterized protein (TIGR00251 family)
VGDVELTRVDGGVRLRLRVKPSARRDRLVGPHDGALKLEVSAPPERGTANRAVVALLSSVLGLKRSGVEIVSGHTSRDKTVVLTGASVAEIERRLHELT